jgi:hypothetical protein
MELFQKPKATTTRSLPKRKIFQFLELPAEIRNIIYNYTLSDPSGINFISTYRHKRRAVTRMPVEYTETTNGTRRQIHEYVADSTRNDDNNNNRVDPVAPLVPSLLAVNKQIYKEGIDILYSNEFVFADSCALYTFLVNIGPQGAQRLKKLRILGWHYGRTKKAYNHACFAVLVWATNLTSFHIDAPIGWYRATNDGADQFYRDAFCWLEAMGMARGKRDAALDILHLGENCFSDYWGSRRSANPNYSHADKVKQFKATVAKCLGSYQEKIMATPVKKRKVKKQES